MKQIVILLMLTALPQTERLFAMASLSSGTNGQTGVSVLFVDMAPPPSTIKDFVGQSRLVVHGVVINSSLPQLDPTSSPLAPRAVRHQTIRVYDVIKNEGSSTLPLEITVVQYGGTLVVKGKEFRTASSEKPFAVGDEYVLFLTTVPEMPGRFVVSAGPAGAFKVDPIRNSVIVPDGVRSAMVAYVDTSHVPIADFVGTVRTFAKR